MCGLVGFITFGKTPIGVAADKRKFIYEGLYLSALRGMDSSGIALIGAPDVTPLIYKKAMAAPDFLQLKQTLKVIANVDRARAVLGHARSATLGEVSDQNAHPFQHDAITLIHNGTLRNYRGMTAGYSGEVDSDHVCHALAHNPAKEVLEKVDGDYCLIWHDSVEKTFNIAKNEGRPLTWAYIDAWNGLAFASEMGTLAAVLARNGIVPCPLSEDKPDLYWTPEKNVLYQWDMTKDSPREFAHIPFVHRPYHSTEGGRVGATGTAGTRMPWTGTGNSKPLSTHMYEARDVLTKSKDKSIPSTDKQHRKAKSRLKGMGVEVNTDYGVDPIGWIPYTANQHNGFVYGNFRAPLKNKLHSFIIHNMKYEDYTVYKDTYGPKLLRPTNAYAVKGVTTFVIGTIPDCKKQSPTLISLLTSGQADLLPEEEDDDSDGIPGEEEEMIEGPDGEWLTREEWIEAAKDGCAICGGALNPEYAEEIYWYPSDTHESQGCCHICTDDPNNKHYFPESTNDRRYKEH